MTDKKLTYKEIIKALPNMTYGGHYCARCKYDNGKGNDRCGVKGCKIARYALDLINRLQAENEKNENIIRLADKTIETANAEIERLKNAYKQCAWERDIFAEDMTQEIKKDCSFLMLDIKTIKTEAYKECLEKVEQRDASESDFYIMVKKTEFDNLVKEMVGEDNASKN